jgi:sodium-dependent dicarboxylate transporter 2/3/5
MWLAFGPVWIDDVPRPQAAQRALAVFVTCLSLWLTHAIPLSITGLLAFVLLPLLKVTIEPEDALAHLGNPAVFFMMGVFFLVAAMIATGLSKRLSLVVLRRFDRSPRSLFAGVVVTSSFLAMWMPEHAVAAMMFPVVLEVSQALGLKPGQSRYARLLFMGMAWGAVIGGVGTFLGGARAPLALSLLQDHLAAHPGPQAPDFLAWMIAALPVVVILTVAAVIVLPAVVGIDVDDVSKATSMIRERVSGLGPISGAELRLAALAILTVAAWIGIGHSVDMGLSIIAIASACALFILRIVKYTEVQDFINWNVLLMYGGAIAIGSSLNETGAIQWIVDNLAWQGFEQLWIVIGLVILALVLTECVSNAATVVVLLPVAFSICQTTGMDPIFATLAVTIPAGLPFALPVSSPPHAIAFSSGYYEPRDCLKAGLIMDVLAVVVFIAVMLLYWPMIGIVL